VPGLGDLPVLGRLFGSTSDTVNKTEIVLLITPRVIRNLARPDVRLEEFSAGTEAAIGADRLPGAPFVPAPPAPPRVPTPMAPPTPPTPFAPPGFPSPGTPAAPR